MKEIIENLKKFGKSILMIFIYIIIIPGIAYALLINSNFDKYSFIKQNLLMLACEMIVFLIVIFVFRKDLIADFKNLKRDFKGNFKFIFKYWLIGIVIMVLFNFLINFVFFKGSIAIYEQFNIY